MWTTNPPSYPAQHADISTFFDYTSGAARIHVWPSNGSDLPDSEYDSGGWWATQSGFPLANVGDRMVSGDFNGDGLNDVAVLYDQGGCHSTIFVWLADPQDPNPQGRFNYQWNNGDGWWDDTGYCLAQVAGRMVAGDFNGDGKDDIATLFQYPSFKARIHVWPSNGSTFTGTGYSSLGWWASDPNNYNLSGVADRFVAGDFTGDGKDDVATFYDYGPGAARIHVWRADPGAPLQQRFVYSGSAGWWQTASGYTLTNVGDRFVAGDFTGDGKADVSSFYQYPSFKARIHVWPSNGSTFTGTGYSSLGWWISDPNNYDLAGVDDRFVAGDLTGDETLDVATFYKYPGSEARIHVWRADPGAPLQQRFVYSGSNGWWQTGSGYNLTYVAGRMIAGDFDGQ